ncbi:MAG: LytR C-terminal domain-containing protein [Solirubrobacterales bacterium]
MELIKEIGAVAGLAAFLGLGLLALLSFAQARDVRRLREWAGSAPERDSERKETTSAAAAHKAKEMRKLEEAKEAERKAADLREERRQRRDAGLPDLGRTERLRVLFSGRGSRLGEPRYLVAILLIVVIVGGGIAYGLLHGFGGGGGRSAASGPLKPSEIEVAVLNGTATPGLAARYRDIVEQRGFKPGTVGNSRASFAASVVMYRRGREPEAKRVGHALHMSRVRLMTSEISSLSSGAPVSVVVGQDNASPTG